MWLFKTVLEMEKLENPFGNIIFKNSFRKLENLFGNQIF